MLPSAASAYGHSPAAVALADADLDELADELGAPVREAPLADLAAPPPAPSSSPIAAEAAPCRDGSSIEGRGRDAPAADGGGAGDVEPDDLRNLEETADLFGVSVPTVRAWIKDGCPVFERGTNGVGYRVSVRAVHAWRQGVAAQVEATRAAREKQNEQLRFELFGGQSLAEKFGGAQFAHLTPKQRLELIEAERKATELEERRGALIRVAALDLVLANAFAAAGARIDAAGDEIAGELALDGEDVDRLRAILDNVRNDVADELQRVDLTAPR
jgi:phage terminase Nu1 subunit (DNA packaging protein)